MHKWNCFGPQKSRNNYQSNLFWPCRQTRNEMRGMKTLGHFTGRTVGSLNASYSFNLVSIHSIQAALQKGMLLQSSDWDCIPKMVRGFWKKFKSQCSNLVPFGDRNLIRIYNLCHTINLIPICRVRVQALVNFLVCKSLVAWLGSMSVVHSCCKKAL